MNQHYKNIMVKNMQWIQRDVDNVRRGINHHNGNGLHRKQGKYHTGDRQTENL